jgi:hypothetical protein
MPTLIVFIDALPYEQLSQLPGLCAWPWQARVRPGFGYSINLHAELFAGLTPDQVGFFGEWMPDAARAPGRRYRHLLGLLDAALRPYVLNRGLQTMLTRGYRPGRPMPNLPLARLGDFALVGEKVTSPAFGHPTIFTIHPHLQAISDRGLRKGARDGQLVARAQRAIDDGVARIYVPLPDLDGIGHLHRTTSDRWRAHLACLDAWVDQLARSFLERQPQGDVFVLSDHGMADVTAGVEFAIERELGRQSPQRYLYFTDSTLVRIWLRDPDLGPAIADFLARGQPWRPISRHERETYGLTRADFGDHIAVLREGRCFEPSTFARHIPAAMHGYHPDDPSQRAVLLHRGAHPPTRAVDRSIHVFGVLNEALGRG